MIRSLRSTRITGLHRYYEAVRLRAPHRYSGPRGFNHLGNSLPRPAAGNPRHWPAAARDDRFPRSMQEPEPGSRHLHAGRHLGSKQVSPRLIPSQDPKPGFAIVSELSTRHQWIAFARLPGSHLTLSRSAFSATFTTPAVMPAQLAAVWNLRLRGGSEGPTLIANAALLRVVLSTWDYPPHSWHNRPLYIELDIVIQNLCYSRDERPTHAWVSPYCGPRQRP